MGKNSNIIVMVFLITVLATSVYAEACPEGYTAQVKQGVLSDPDCKLKTVYVPTQILASGKVTSKRYSSENCPRKDIVTCVKDNDPPRPVLVNDPSLVPAVKEPKPPIRVVKKTVPIKKVTPIRIVPVKKLPVVRNEFSNLPDKGHVIPGNSFVVYDKNGSPMRH